MLVQDIIDVPVDSLSVLKLNARNYTMSASGVCSSEGYIVAVDEKGRLLGKIRRDFLEGPVQASKLPSKVEPLKETILNSKNALEIIDYLKSGTNSLLYVVDPDNQLIGAVLPDSRVLGILEKMRNFLFLPNIFDALHEAVIIIDAGGTIVYVNHAYANIVGVPGGKIIGRKMKDVEPTSSCLKVLQGHPPFINQRVQIQSIGVEVLANITPFYSDGKLQGVISIFRNIYEAINLGAELRKVYDIARYIHNGLKSDSSLLDPFRSLVGTNSYFQQALVLASTVSGTDVTVMIRGESGSGKEILASAIQKSGARKDSPFIKVNCASIPESLLESELFGYDEGAFTGAKRGGKPGKFELAHGGTIFLDEVGDMSQAMQARLLRVLQESEIERVGGSSTIAVDVRVISATNKDLETMVVKGTFREDLYYRLNVIPIFLPPLRKRKDDIPLLADHFLRACCKKHSKGRLVISSGVMNILIAHDWPGNIRELKNVIEHAVVLCQSDMIEIGHLPRHFKKAQSDPGLPNKLENENLPGLVERLEREVISRAVQKYRNRSGAIKALGISRRTFYSKLKKYNIALDNK